MAVTEMVSEHNWAPDFFGSQEVWSPRNLDPEKFSPRMKIIIWHFHAGTKFLEDKNSRRPKKSWAKVRFGTISNISLSFSSPEQFTLLRFQQLHTVWLRVDLFYPSSANNKS